MHDPDVDIELRLLFEAIYLKYSHDFRSYSTASMKRRVTLALTRLHARNITELIERVLHEPGFFPQLLQYLTVPTTEMFRDPEYYRCLRERVMPFLRTYPSVKIWVAGCSTGEELYSLAILLKEEGLLERTIIYATDINPISLAHAEQGVYPLAAMRQFTAHYQSSGGKRSFADYYSTTDESAVMDSSLRRGVVFADHSLATDNVFAETQFVSCRNVLIYFNRALQDRALRLFADSLCMGGFLGLGSKETVRFSVEATKFEVLDQGNKLFRKKAAVA